MNKTPAMADVERRFDAMIADVNEAFDQWKENPDQTVTVTFSAGEARAILKALGEYLPGLGAVIMAAETLLDRGVEPPAGLDPNEGISGGYEFLDRGLSAAANIVSSWRAESNPIPDEVPAAWLYDPTLDSDVVAGDDSDA